MAEKTGISWADATFNPWIGCTKVSPACDGCYAENLMATRMGRVKWGKPGDGAGTRLRTSESYWAQLQNWNANPARLIGHERHSRGERPLVFGGSLCDPFDNEVPIEWLADYMLAIEQAPNLDFFLLTKRPQLIRKRLVAVERFPLNVGLGTTCEDQERANINALALVQASDRLVGLFDHPPMFLGISAEPLLGPVDLTSIPNEIGFRDVLRGTFHSLPVQHHNGPLSGTVTYDGVQEAGSYITWVITGGETNQGKFKARPSSPAWFRSLRDQCAAAAVPYHHKQNGEFIESAAIIIPDDRNPMVDGIRMLRVGKKVAGRALDGATHNDRPAYLSYAEAEA